MHSFVADKHNFGRSVVRLVRGSSTWYQKPRTTFWEHFFFGKDSPLRESLSVNGVNSSRELSSFLFNLDVEVPQKWMGFANEVKTVERADEVSNLWYSFGVLTAYSYVFGIRDLHKHNVLLTSNGVQAVDAEVVFTSLVLPCETALTPYKNVPFEVSALSRISSLPNLSELQTREFFMGYLDLFGGIFDRFDDIKKIVVDSIPADLPIRVILRNTREYLNHMSGAEKIVDLIDEEQEQLARGDVPYFFKILGDNNFYFVSTTDFESRKVTSDLGSFKTNVSRHGCSIDDLLANREALDKKMAQGVLYFCRTFNASDVRTITWRSKSVAFDRNSFKNEYTGLEVALKR